MENIAFYWIEIPIKLIQLMKSLNCATNIMTTIGIKL